jgi:hypothetical protein
MKIASAPAAAPPPRQKRMTLASVTRGKIKEPYRILLYGVEKIGKSTFAAEAPAPVFIDAERGSTALDVARFPTPDSWQDVIDAIQELETGDHKHQTVVLDTVDWIETLLWTYVCERDKKTDIEAYGFGKGYVAALSEWRLLVAALDRLTMRRGMNVILLAHCWIKPFKNPEGDDFDRYELKLNGKAAGFLKEWPKAVLFANHETLVAKDDKTKRVRGVSTGARLIYTERTAAYDAGTRYPLPPSLPLSWAEFQAAAESGTERAAELRAEIEKKAQALGGDVAARIAESLKKAGDDAEKLSQLNGWVNNQIAKKEAASNG